MLDLARYELNRLRGDWGYHLRRTRSSNFPFISNLELTNYCTLRCVYCPMPQVNTRAKGYMSIELFEKLVAENRHNLRSVCLYFHGESLLHPDFTYFLRRLKQLNCGVGLATNGLALDSVAIKNCLTYGLDSLVISFQGVNKQVYETEQRAGSFDRVETNIQATLQQRKRACSKMRVYVSVLETALAKPYIPEFAAKWSRLGAEVLICPVEDWISLLTSRKRLTQNVCADPWHNLAVTWNGDIFPCCFYEGEPIGNIEKQTVDELWNSEPYVNLRRGILFDHGSLSFPCESCDLGTRPDGLLGFVRAEAAYAHGRLNEKLEPVHGGSSRRYVPPKTSKPA